MSYFASAALESTETNLVSWDMVWYLSLPPCGALHSSRPDGPNFKNNISITFSKNRLKGSLEEEPFKLKGPKTGRRHQTLLTELLDPLQHLPATVSSAQAQAFYSRKA